MAEKLILRNFQSAGDIVMLTAAVRDLHRCYPGRYLTDVRTSCSDLWIGNPWLTPLDESDPCVRVIDCHYPIIHKSNSAPYHFLFGFVEYLNDELGLRIQPTDYRGDIHLTEQEKTWFDKVEEAKGGARPFWLFASGGKWDYTIKWWASSRYQEVVDHFRGRIDFVQVGEIASPSPGHRRRHRPPGKDQPAPARAAHSSRSGRDLGGEPAHAPRGRGAGQAGDGEEPPLHSARRRP